MINRHQKYTPYIICNMLCTNPRSILKFSLVISSCMGLSFYPDGTQLLYISKLQVSLLGYPRHSFAWTKNKNCVILLEKNAYYPGRQRSVRPKPGSHPSMISLEDSSPASYLVPVFAVFPYKNKQSYNHIQ